MKTELVGHLLYFRTKKERILTLGTMISDVEQRINFQFMREFKLARIQQQLEKYDLAYGAGIGV